MIDCGTPWGRLRAAVLAAGYRTQREFADAVGMPYSTHAGRVAASAQAGVAAPAGVEELGLHWHRYILKLIRACDQRRNQA